MSDHPPEVGLSRAQFASAVGADEKWVENTARALGRTLAYTPAEARWFGVVRLLARDFAMPVARAAGLADEALRHPPETRALPLVVSTDGAATLVIDLARYHSAFAAALSAALNHGGPRRRGRPQRKQARRGRDAVAAAEAFGVDVSLLRHALERSVAERLGRLDSNAAFLGAVRPAARSGSLRVPGARGRRR